MLIGCTEKYSVKNSFYSEPQFFAHIEQNVCRTNGVRPKDLEPFLSLLAGNCSNALCLNIFFQLKCNFEAVFLVGW
jgi:hypothetical protein